MDFYRRKFKSKSNPNQDAISVLNEKEYKCISLQAITGEVIKENNKKQIKNLIEEINGHLADLRIVLEDETDVKIKERCQILTKQFEESLLKLISSHENEHNNANKGSDSVNNVLSLPIKTTQGPGSKPNTVILNEVEEKLKAMRQKRLNRLSTFVNEQTKLAEQRAEEGKNADFETAIKTLQENNDTGAALNKPPVDFSKSEGTRNITDINVDKIIPTISNKAVLTASNIFLQNRHTNVELGPPKPIINLNNVKTSTSNTSFPVKPVLKNSRQGFLKSVDENPLEPGSNIESIKEEKTKNEKDVPIPSMKLSTFGTQDQTADKTTHKLLLPSPNSKNQEFSKPLSPKPNVRKFLNKINTYVIPNDFEKSTEDIYQQFTEKDNKIKTTNVSKIASVPEPKTVEELGKIAGQKNDIQNDVRIEIGNLETNSGYFEGKKEQEYIEMEFNSSRKYPLKINTIKQTQNINLSKMTFSQKTESTTIKDESSNSFAVENPEYFASGSVKNMLSESKENINKTCESTKISEVNDESKKDDDALELSNPVYFDIEFKNIIQQDTKIQKNNFKTQEMIKPEEKDNTPLKALQKRRLSNTKSSSRQCSRIDNDYSFYQKRKVIKRLFSNWDSLSEILSNDSGTETEELEDILENLDAVSDVVQDIQNIVKEKLRDNQKHAKNTKNGSKILQDMNEKLTDIEREISKFNGLKRDAKYLQLSNQLSSYFLKVNEVCSKNANNVIKNEILNRINGLVKELEEKVNRNARILAKILEEQVELIGSKK